MKITQDVRDYADALEKGEIEIKMLDVEAEMQQKSAEFKASGSEIYHAAK